MISLFHPLKKKTRFLINHLPSLHPNSFAKCINDAFQIVSIHNVEEFSSNFVLYKHKRTGMLLMSATAPESIKTFAINFLTIPKDNSGMSHILEHCVLCGSQKYPLRNPLADIERSLKDEMIGPFTDLHRTCYPCASPRSKDLYLLAKIHMDAVFFPLCLNYPHILKQEAGRHVANRFTKTISFKGVVHSEMQSAYCLPGTLLARATMEALFPESEYRFDFGGDPDCIEHVTYDGLQAFHRKHYRPENCFLWFYGDDDATKRLQFVDDFLKPLQSTYTRREKVTLQEPFAAPRTITKSYPIGEGQTLDNKFHVSISWVLSERLLDVKTEFLLRIVGKLVESHLVEVLFESGLGKDVICHGIQFHMVQPMFTIALMGTSESLLDEVKELGPVWDCGKTAIC